MNAQLDEYSYLWDGTDTDWVLVPRDPELGSAASASIYNQRTRMMLLIEDDALAKALVDRMREAKVRVIDAIPPGEFVP